MRLFDRQTKTNILTPLTPATAVPNALMWDLKDDERDAGSQIGIEISNELKNAEISASGGHVTADCSNGAEIEPNVPNEPKMAPSPTMPAQIEASEAVKWLQSTPSRRNLLKATTALAGMPLLAGLTAPQRDCELIQLCEKFGELERTSRVSSDYENKEIWSALLQRQQALADRICAMKPATLEEFRALARAVTGWSHNMEDDELEDMNGRDEQLFAFLMRGLVEAKS